MFRLQVVLDPTPTWILERETNCKNRSVCVFVLFCCGWSLFVCLFGGVSKAGGIRTLPKTSLPVAVLRVAKGRIP